MCAPALDFARLKRRVSLEQVLIAKGLTASLKHHGNRLVGPCPVHGGDNPHAFVADLAKNLWYCFTRCQGGGDVVELVRRRNHLSYRQSACYLAALAQDPIPGGAWHAAPPSRPFRPFTRRLVLDAAAPWLAQKGISADTAARFEAGTYHGRGFLACCIGVRLHDPAGQPLGYARRRLDPQAIARYGKWQFPCRMPKKDLLYGFHLSARRYLQCLVLVEGPWAVMRLAQLGVPAAALLGTQLSPAQHQLLRALPQLTLIVILLLGSKPCSSLLALSLPSTSIPPFRFQLPRAALGTERLSKAFQHSLRRQGICNGLRQWASNATGAGAAGALSPSPFGRATGRTKPLISTYWLHARGRHGCPERLGCLTQYPKLCI